MFASLVDLQDLIVQCQHLFKLLAVLWRDTNSLEMLSSCCGTAPLTGKRECEEAASSGVAARKVVAD